MRTHIPSVALTLTLAATAVACADTNHAAQDADVVQSKSSPIAEGSPLAIGVVDFLNDKYTDLFVLDELVPLNRLAAEALIDHRNGPTALSAPPTTTASTTSRRCSP